MKNIIFLFLFLPIACASKHQEPVSPKQDSVSMDNLIYTVWSLPFKYKKIIVAQAVLETGWFKSKNFVVNNNLFGMKKPNTRVTTSDSANNGYAHYNNWRHSVIDYYLLQSTTESIYPTHSEHEYYRYLDRIYSEVGSSYSSQLKDIIKRIDFPETQEDLNIDHHKKHSANVKKKNHNTHKSVRISRNKKTRHPKKN